MNIFISWSGSLSGKVAALFNRWIENVIQTAVPFLSSENIENGSKWFGAISDHLRESSIAVVFLTKSNKHSHWIHFEAGMLTKGLDAARLMTVLVDLEPSDVDQPLAQWHHTMLTKEGMRQMVGTLNKYLARPLSDDRIRHAFETNWPEFEAPLKAILEQTPATEPVKKDGPQERLLREILDTVRRLESRQAPVVKDAENLRTWHDIAHLGLRYIAQFPDEPSEGIATLMEKDWGIVLDPDTRGRLITYLSKTTGTPAHVRAGARPEHIFAQPISFGP